jgi:hypothetical protein
MRRILRRRVALTVAVVAVLAGGTAVALGATTAPKHARTARHARVHTRGERRQGIIQAAAGYLGLAPSQLGEQLRQGKSLAQIAAATPGKTEAGLVAAIVEAVKAKIPSPPADLETRVKAIVNRSPRTELARHARLGSRRHGALRTAALSYLGITRHQLIEQLKSGKTLAQVADSTPGKSAAGLTGVLLGTFKGKLDARVAAHQLSKSAETARLALLRSRISRLLAWTHTGHHAAHHAAAPGTTPAP